MDKSIIYQLLKQNIEIEGILRAILARDSAEAYEILTEKVDAFNKNIEELMARHKEELPETKTPIAESAVNETYVDEETTPEPNIAEQTPAEAPVAVVTATEEPVAEPSATATPTTPENPIENAQNVEDEEITLNDTPVEEAAPQQDDKQVETTLQLEPPTLQPQQPADIQTQDEKEPEKEDNAEMVIDAPQTEELSDPESPTFSTAEDVDDEITLQTPPQKASKLTVDEMIVRKEAADLSHAFTINDKFRYIREIFDNNPTKFNFTINLLSNMNSLGDAFDYLLNDIELDPDDENVKEFLSVVSTHFNSK